MIKRKLTEESYQNLCMDIQKNARSRPVCPLYEVDSVFNGRKYILTIQPDRHNTVAALFAVYEEYDCGSKSIKHVLITNNLLLSALLEITIFQGIRKISA